MKSISFFLIDQLTTLFDNSKSLKRFFVVEIKHDKRIFIKIRWINESNDISVFEWRLQRLESKQFKVNLNGRQKKLIEQHVDLSKPSFVSSDEI